MQSTGSSIVAEGKQTRTRYVCDGPLTTTTMRIASGGKKGAFDPPSAAEYAHPRIDEDRDCRYVLETYCISVPNKNDGLLGTVTNTWDPPRTKGSGPNLGSHSLLYNDRPSSNQYKQGGTGYNHAEMVYNRRRYSASEDPGISDGEFSRGQLNPPMEEGRRFLERQVFR